MFDKIRNPKIWLTALAAAAALSAACTDAGSITGSGGAPGSAGPMSSADGGSAASVATVKADQIQVFSGPDASDVTQKLGQKTEFGSPQTFLVMGRQDDMVQVELPVRPNGSTGWVKASDVDVETVDYSVRVDLGGNTLTVSKGDEVVLTTRTADGKDSTPTPAGTFYVTDLLATGNDNGAYGPFAFGTSAHSDAELGSQFGEGWIGIHGTNAPKDLGKDVSHGCIRVDNETVSKMAEILPLGTPVFVA